MVLFKFSAGNMDSGIECTLCKSADDTKLCGAADVLVVSHWKRLPREAVAAPSLAMFKARLAGALSSLVWWKVFLLMAGGLELDDF